MVFEIITPLEKQERTTRRMDKENFSIRPGMFVELLSNGDVQNVTPGSPAISNRMATSDVSSNKYESQDSCVGSVTTIEAYDVRVVIGSHAFIGTPVVGDSLGVCVTAPNAGKLFSMRENPNTVTGDYEEVAVVEEVDVGTVVIRTVSHNMVTLPIGAPPVVVPPAAIMYYFSQMSQDYGY